MKKIQFFSFIAMFSMAAMICSCNKSDVISFQDFSSKKENDDLKRNEATWSSLGPEKLWGLNFRLFLGHTVEQCGGKCVKFFGQYGHVDCRGFGNVCNLKVSAYYSVSQNPDYVTLTLTDVDALGTDLEYPFPERSFYITNPQNNTELWLNIPEQTLERTNTAEPFVIENIWFSEEQELENE